MNVGKLISFVIISMLTAACSPGHADRARVALAEAEACYQQSVRVGNDSLLNEAVEYFRQQPESSERQRAFYLRGYQNYLAGNYGNAIVDYLDAEQAARHLGDSTALGLTYRAMGDVYYAIKDYRSSLDSHQKSARIFELLKPEKYYPYSNLELARAYFNAFDYVNSIKTLKALLNRIQDFDPTEQAAIYCLLAYSYINERQYDEAKSYVNIVQERYPAAMDARFIQNAGHLAHIMQRPDEFEFYRDALHSLQPENHWLDYLHALQINDDQSALKLLQNEYKETQSFIENTLAQDIRNVANRFYETQNRYFSEQSKQKSQIIILILISSVLIVISLSLYLCYRRKLQEEENEKHAEFVRQLSQALNQYKTENSSLKESNSNLEHLIAVQTKTNIAESRKLALPPKFDALTKMCETYYCYKTSKNIQTKVFKELAEIVSSFRISNPNFKEFANYIDKNNNNVYSNFKNDYSDFNDSEYELFAFLVVGFSAKIISLIQDIELDKLYSRKNYLKKKITSRLLKNTTIYLQYF